MSKKSTPSKKAPLPPHNIPQQLVMITPEMTQELIAPITKALEGFAVSALIIHIAPMPLADKSALMREFIPHLQRQNIACLIADDTEVAVKSFADGIYAKSPLLLASAMKFHPKMMVICGGIATKDDAMGVGDLGIDAIAFGDELAKMPLVKRVERLAWWASIFEIPVIGVAENAEEITAIADTKCEFLALGAWGFTRPIIKQALEALK